MKKVVIIGGGPAGFAVAKALLLEKAFHVTILDSQPGPGGVWLYNGKSPMYQSLTTNLPVTLMEYKSRPFGGNSMRFADRQEVYDYVAAYAHDTPASSVEYNTEVAEVSKIGDEWLIQDTRGRTWLSDFVVVATGHYTFPSIPPEFSNAPSGVIHTKHYQTPEPFRNKKVLLVGNGPSAIDIGVQLLAEVATPLHIARQRVGPQDTIFTGDDALFMSAVTEIREGPSGRTEVLFHDGHRELYDIVMLATGYTYDFPFLAGWDRRNPEGDKVLHPRRSRLCNLYQRMFYIRDPTIAFVAMEKNIVPLPFAENQGVAIARVWNRRLPLPMKADMQMAECQELLKRGTDQQFHNLTFPDDTEYMAQIWDWTAMSTGTGGFVAERWDDSKLKLRKDAVKLKEFEFRQKVVNARAKAAQHARLTTYAYPPQPQTQAV